MNRRERRAAKKQPQVAAAASLGAAGLGPHYLAMADMFARARQLREKGLLGEAEEVCHQILAINPNHAGSLHILGSIALQVGRADIAIFWLDKAVVSDDRDAAIQNERGLAFQALGRVADAIASFRNAVRLDPKNGRTHNNLGIALWRQGKTGEAAAEFAAALRNTSELFDQYGAVCGTLFDLNPVIGTAAKRAMNQWPQRVSIESLFSPNGYTVVASDPLLHCMLVCSPVRGVELERLLTNIRSALLKSVVDGVTGEINEFDLNLRCAIAQQCFINEYVFATSSEELAAVEQLRQLLISAFEKKASVSPQVIAAVASYFALDKIPGANVLLDRTIYPDWPAPIEAVLTMQLREPLEEQRLRATIAVLTPIEDATSILVRRQYEENPYPRWILPSSRTERISLNTFLRKHWPLAPLRSVGESDSLDVLVPGCGTGKLPIGVAQIYTGANVLGVDLSLASLAYAQRKSRELHCENVTYVQGDILKLESIGRTFDFIDVAGVLHHLADPEAGWRVLLSLLRPNGVMRVALYSELARRDIVAARTFCAEREIRTTVEDIRFAREALLDSEFQRKMAQIHDFYTTSECRDLLFHVQEQRFTIARIRKFISEQDLNFIGFQITPYVVAKYGKRFPDDSAMRNLDNWEAFERDEQDTFISMYQFWVQKR